MSIPPSKGPTYTRILIVVYPFTRTRSYLHPSLPRLCTRLLTSLCLIRKAEPKRFNNLEQEVPSFQILPPLSCSHISLFRKKKKKREEMKKKKRTRNKRAKTSARKRSKPEQHARHYTNFVRPCTKRAREVFREKKKVKTA